MSLVYPTAASIAKFAELVARFDLLLEFLPPIDDDWAKVIEGDFFLCQMHPDGQNLPKAAARLFYRVIKNHHFADGNKRSALIALYEFLYANNSNLRLNWQEMYNLAKEVAASSRDSEVVITDLADRFERFLIPLTSRD